MARRERFSPSAFRKALPSLCVLALAALAAAAQDAPAPRDISLLPDRLLITAELDTSIDAGRAKPGDKVELEVVYDVRNATGTLLIPRKARLLGRVVSLLKRSKGQPESRLGIVVYEARWADGAQALNAVIESVSETSAPAPPSRTRASSVPSTPTPDDPIIRPVDPITGRPPRREPEPAPSPSPLRGVTVEDSDDPQARRHIVSRQWNIYLPAGISVILTHRAPSPEKAP
jgi:hypothetical protein